MRFFTQFLSKKLFLKIIAKLMERLNNLSIVIMLIHCKNHLKPVLLEPITHGLHYYILIPRKQWKLLIFRNENFRVE